MDGPIFLQADDDLAEEMHHPDRAVGDHEKLASDTVIECVCSLYPHESRALGNSI
jgi:hypothetical protein